MSLQITPPQQIFYDKDGTPLDAGFIYVGELSQNPETNQVAVYWDAAMTQPAPQPIRTLNGYVSRQGVMAKIYTDSSFSITVRNKRGELVFSSSFGNSNGNNYALLVFPDYATASAAAATLPDGQVLVAPDADGRESNFHVLAGALVWQEFTPGWKLENAAIVYASWFEIHGDGSDEATKLNAALSAAAGGILDLQGLEVTAGDALTSQNYTASTTLKNGSINYIGSRRQFALLVEASAAITLRFDKFYVHASNLTAKSLAVRANVAGVSVYGDQCGGGAARSEADEGLAAGLYIYPASGVLLERVELTAPVARDVDAIGSSLVGRGVMVQDAKTTIIKNPDIRRVGPYQDGDGIFVVASDPNSDFVCEIEGGYYEDCQKRAVKTQVKDATVLNPTVRRTQAFADGSGQCEVDLQYGGVSSGGVGYYASGCVPAALVGGSGSGVTLDGFTAICEDTNDVIGALAILGNFSGVSQNGIRIRNITTNCKARCAVRAYSNKTVAEYYQFDGVQVDGLRGKELTRAFIEIARGAATNVRALISARSCRFGNGTTIPASFLDPNAGSTTFLAIDFESLDGCSGFNQAGLNYLDTRRNVVAKSVVVAENAAASLTLTLSFNRAARVAVVYANARNASAEGRLYLDGIAFPGGTTAEWVQLAGSASSAGLGALSVSVSGQVLTISKSAGALTGSGRLQLMAVFDDGVS